MREFFIFPAVYSVPDKAYRVCAMMSEAYGSRHGDPQAKNALVPAELVPHKEIRDWIHHTVDGPGGPIVSLIGRPGFHTPLHNQPTTMLITFPFSIWRGHFMREFGI